MQKCATKVGSYYNMNMKWRNETNLGHRITICSPTPFVNPGARKSSKENETSSSGLYLSRYGLATKVSRKAALCAAATQCKNFFRKNSNIFPRQIVCSENWLITYCGWHNFGENISWKTDQNNKSNKFKKIFRISRFRVDSLC